MKTNNINKKLEQFAAANNVCLMILAAGALTAFLVYTRVILMPFVIAYFIYMLLNTAAAYMKEKWHVPTFLGLLATVLLFVCLSVLSIFFISASIESFIQSTDIYASKLNDTIDWFILTAQKMGIVLNSEVLMNYLNNIPVFNMVKTMGSNIVSIFTNAGLISLFVIFIFMSSTKEKTNFVSNIEKQISYYLIIKILVSLLTGFFTWLTLTLVGAELALMIAFITFALNFIPNIGPFIATMLPIPVLFLQYGFDWHIILAISLLITIHFVIGNILETKWLGKGMDLDPVIVIACLIFWALVWGVMGALLAVPLTSIAKMIFERYKPTRPLAAILAGRRLLG